jgi:hypothetical protein
MVSKLDEAQYTRLIDNAYRAYNNCGTEWGKNYWQGVIITLNRYFGRLQ